MPANGATLGKVMMRMVRAGALKMLKEKRPDIEIVGDEVHPLLKVTDFSPYIAKIKASGADSVITGNWGQDLALLIKAAADAGLQSDWYTYYAGGAGGPTAIKQTGQFDIGGLAMTFGPDDNEGLDKVFLTVLQADGKFKPVEKLGKLSAN